MTRRVKQFKVENGMLMMSQPPLLPRKQIGRCYFCDIPVFVSEGQLLKYYKGQPTHKSCRPTK